MHGGHSHHDHSQQGAHSHIHSASRNIAAAFFLNVGFTILELVGGYLTGSVAIMADAVHDLGDSVSLGFAWYLERLAGKGRDPQYSYGYRRFSLLSALISGVVIVSGSILILREAIPRFWSPQLPNGKGMLALAVVGVVINGIAAIRLSRGATQNEKVLRWHLFEDSMGWFAVLLGSICIVAFGWTWMDPFLAVGLAIWVLYNVVRVLRETMGLFLQGKPHGFDEDGFRARVSALTGVHDLHDLHVWSLDGVRNVLSFHLVLAEGTGRQRLVSIKNEVHGAAKELGFFHITIETEILGDECPENCDDPPPEVN